MNNGLLTNRDRFKNLYFSFNLYSFFKTKNEKILGRWETEATCHLFLHMMPRRYLANFPVFTSSQYPNTPHVIHFRLSFMIRTGQKWF